MFVPMFEPIFWPWSMSGHFGGNMVSHICADCVQTYHQIDMVGPTFRPVDGPWVGSP